MQQGKVMHTERKREMEGQRETDRQTERNIEEEQTRDHIKGREAAGAY